METLTIIFNIPFSITEIILGSFFSLKTTYMFSNFIGLYIYMMLGNSIITGRWNRAYTNEGDEIDVDSGLITNIIFAFGGAFLVGLISGNNVSDFTYARITVLIIFYGMTLFYVGSLAHIETGIRSSRKDL